MHMKRKVTKSSPPGERRSLDGDFRRKTRKVVFVVDEEYKKTEKTVLRYLFREVNADNDSTVITHNQLQDDGSFCSDVLVVRSSRRYDGSDEEIKKLKRKIAYFKVRNPDTVIVVFALGYSKHLQEMVTIGIIDQLHGDLTQRNDVRTVEGALRLLDRKRSEYNYNAI